MDRPTKPTDTTPGYWPARLELRFARRGDGTAAVLRRHVGPLRVQRMFYPEGPRCCHALLLHPPAGIAGGDRLAIEVVVEAASHALLTTPGATKWYRTGNADEARQDLTLSVADDACLEWLPQESILFDGARAVQWTDISLEPRAAMFGWDIVQLGRLAAGEHWLHGSWRQQLILRRGGKLVWRERAELDAAAAARASVLALAGHDVFATAWACSPRLTTDVAAALAAARATVAAHDLEAQGLACGISWLSAPAELLIIRVLAHDAQTLRGLLEALWHTLRPWVAGIPAVRPRIWHT